MGGGGVAGEVINPKTTVSHRLMQAPLENRGESLKVLVGSGISTLHYLKLKCVFSPHFHSFHHIFATMTQLKQQFGEPPPPHPSRLTWQPGARVDED